MGRYPVQNLSSLILIVQILGEQEMHRIKHSDDHDVLPIQRESWPAMLASVVSAILRRCPDIDLMLHLHGGDIQEISTVPVNSGGFAKILRGTWHKELVALKVLKSSLTGDFTDLIHVSGFYIHFPVFSITVHLHRSDSIKRQHFGRNLRTLVFWNYMVFIGQRYRQLLHLSKIILDTMISTWFRHGWPMDVPYNIVKKTRGSIKLTWCASQNVYFPTHDAEHNFDPARTSRRWLALSTSPQSSSYSWRFKGGTCITFFHPHMRA